MTGKQNLFIDAYFVHNCNATRAAAAAGYKSPHVQGAEIKRHPEVAAEIKRRLDENALTANEVIALLADVAQGSAESVLRIERVKFRQQHAVPDEDGPRDAKGRPTAIRFLDGPEEERVDVAIDWEKARDNGALRLIKSFGYDANGLPKIEMYDALAARTTLAKHHKLLTDKVEVTGKDGAPLFGEYTDEELDRRLEAAEAGKAQTALPG